jgi:hypothetical protein
MLINSLTDTAEAAAITSSLVAILSLIFNVYQHRRRKDLSDHFLGFLHGLKPSVEAAALGQALPASLWQGALGQINNLMERIQPPKK